MANYYTEASFLVRFESAEKEEEASDILETLIEHEEKPCTGELADLAKDMQLDDWGYIGFSWAPEINLAQSWPDWWITADETINVDHAAVFFHYLVKKDLLKPMGFEWSNTCSKARLDAFGGGAVWITKEGTEWMTTCGWLGEKEHAALRAV